ncbi:uncharacterized protein LOC102476904 [Tupaia chinensis]|uniref:uncharacterized protein LOC102476904 n=1 Tax=Tupaia chinensis TaxID=246437 RepID=UPI000FFC7D1E|nr:uncharacterized protein LOC102476904 [Tupaia chinensis]
MNIVKGTIFVFLLGLGMVGNLSIFVNYMWIFFLDAEKKPVHVILIHLTFTNVIMILTKAMHHMMVAFGAVRHILHFLLFFWVFNTLIKMDLLDIITGSSRNGSQVIENHYYCHAQSQSKVTRWLTLSGIFFCTFYIMFLLHKHHKHALYLRNSTKCICTTPPEIKAAQSILLLLLCFLFFYWTDSIITLCVNYSLKNNFILLNFQELLILGHAILSPFVMIYRDRRLAKCCHINKT